MKKLVILGSTGSIGTQSLAIVREYPDDLKVLALSCGSNVKLLEEQIREFSPKYAAVWDASLARELKESIKDLSGVRILSGMDGLLALAALPEGDVLLCAVVGMIGIRPVLAAIEAGKSIALANKETLVCAGHIIMPYARERGVNIYPVDSEHSAIFQCLNGEPKERLTRIWLTCSGGPFRGKKKDELKSVVAADALKHPNWAMGKKITIDSATMVNKGLEVMEAKWLFDVDYEQIKVLVHPQSIVHSMVEYADGAVIAQLGAPDMRLPIQYALFYPDRRPADKERPRVDFYEQKNLSFEEPDTENFPALLLAYRAGLEGGIMPTVFNAANEEAVAHFLGGRAGFLQIAELIEGAMDAIKNVDGAGLEDILSAEGAAREWVRKRL